MLSLTWLGEHALASGGGDEAVRIWDARQIDETLLEMEESVSGSVFALAHDSEAGRLYGAVGRDVCLWDVQTGSWLSHLTGCHRKDVYALALGRDRLLSAGDDSEVFSWPRQALEEEVHEAPEGARLVDANELPTKLCPGTSITSLVGLGEGPDRVLVGTWEGEIVEGDVHGCQMRVFGGDGVWRTEGRRSPVVSLAATADAVAAGCEDGSLKLLRMAP